jgi:P-type E1-E2 ATPase
VPVFTFICAVVLPSELVAPGDLVVIEANQQLPCDIILLQGSCVINEASLTGESIPVLKSPLPNDEDDIFDSEMHSKHVLFNGTSVMQVKAIGDQKVIGVAYGTGFATLKGELIRSILFPKPTKFAFYRDSFKFVFVLAGIGAPGSQINILCFILSPVIASSLLWIYLYRCIIRSFRCTCRILSCSRP